MEAHGRLRENLLVHLTYLHRNTPGMSVTESPTCIVSDSGLPADTFNTVFLRSAGPSLAGDLAAAVGQFRSRGFPFAVWAEANTADQTADVTTLLGLSAVEFEPGMALDLAQWEPAEPRAIEVIPVASAERLADFARVLAAVWDPPDQNVIEFYTRCRDVLLDSSCPIRLLVGCEGGQPVATCEVCITGRTAGVYNVSTLREHQRRGIGTAMTRAGLADAVARGCTLGCLTASPEGVPVYQRLGFAECCAFVGFQ